MDTSRELLDSARALATPSVFIRSVLGIEQYDWQAKVSDLVVKRGARVALRVCNEGGKTSKVVAPSIVALMQMFPNSLVVSTAGVSRQVYDQLIPNLRVILRNSPGWRVTTDSVYAPNGSRYIGFATDDAGKFEGWHTPDAPMGLRVNELSWLAEELGYSKGDIELTDKSFLFMVVDEAKSVKQGIFDAIERCRPDALLVCSSPGEPQGPFYDCFHSQSHRYETFKIPYTECPHLMVSPKVDEIAEQMKTLPKPLVDSMIFAEFPEGGEDMVFEMGRVEGCMGAFIEPWGVGRRGAVDLSGGGDEQPFYVRDGNRVIGERIFREGDATVLARELIKEFQKYELRPEWICADNGGIGEAIIDLLTAMGWPINRIDFGGKAKNWKHYRNVRTEMYFELARRVKSLEVGFQRDDELKRQLSWQKYKLDESQRLALTPKKDMPHSPDRADALAMLFYGMPDKRAFLRERKDEGWRRVERLTGGGGSASWMDEMNLVR